jgi:flagellar basal-body rod protein FlgB
LIASQTRSSTDAVLETSLNHRLALQEILASNIVNANTPGFRALGYEFESQLRAATGDSTQLLLKTSDGRHNRHPGLSQDGKIKPDVFVKPSESISNDGNTVDIDSEMAELSKNQILYRTTIELINRKLGMLRYGINGGR